MREPDSFPQVFRAETAGNVSKDVLETHHQLNTGLAIL